MGAEIPQNYFQIIIQSILSIINSFITISGISEGIYKEKGSKFLSFALPVTTVEEVKVILDEYRKKFYDSRHVCYAYMLGTERADFRANDDGEPSGTAGRPILGQINSFELTDVLVIVVRYFGGILLGTGGLITAYKEAARDALSRAEIVEKVITQRFEIRFGYELMNEVLRVFKEFEPEILKSELQYDCRYVVDVPKASSEQFFQKMNTIYGVKIERTNMK